MDEQKKLSDIEEAASALIANAEEEKPAYKSIIGRVYKQKAAQRNFVAPLFVTRNCFS